MMYFSPDFLPWDKEYTIHIAPEVYEKFHKPTGSYTVLFARLIGLSYADSLRYFHDYYNAKIIGKDGIYCIMRFEQKEDCEKLCKLLSSRWEYIVRRL